MSSTEYKSLREMMGTQAEVARMLETARETIARRETGKNRITKEAALALEALANKNRLTKTKTKP